MTARQLSLGLFDDLTPFDRQLLGAIRDRADPQTATARSLFDVAVNRAGLSYWYSLDRLGRLADLGYVAVERGGPGVALTMRLLV